MFLPNLMFVDEEDIFNILPLGNSEQQKIADEKNIRRIQREMERVATMMQATTEEHNSVSTINHHIRDQLHAAQEKAFRTEESLKVGTQYSIAQC